MTHTLRTLRTGGLALAGVTGALVLSACGSTGPSSAAASGAPNPKTAADFLKFSQCMRSHGVSKFPDPSPGGGISISDSSGVNPQSPSFQAAQKVCQKLLPGGGPGAHPLSAAQREQLIAQSQCMRTHGVPNFPDPQFQGGGVRIGLGPNSGIQPSSPAFQQAVKACGGLGRKGSKGGFAVRIAG
jgi:hypothetical protein